MGCGRYPSRLGVTEVDGKGSFSLASAVLLGLIALVLAPAPATAQARIPDEFTNLQVFPEDIEQRELIGRMRGFTSGLGVGRCSHCHTVSDGLDQPDDDFASDDKPTKVKARAMLRMVQAINADHIAQLPDRGEPAVEVTCVTCHSGKPRPTTLAQEITWAMEDGGPDAMSARYAELREQYFGRGAFDFGARTLENVAQAMGRQNPEGALAILELNLEHHPESVGSWLLKGQVHGLAGDTAAAVAAFERSLELAAGNPVATQQLQRLRGGGT